MASKKRDVLRDVAEAWDSIEAAKSQLRIAFHDAVQAGYSYREIAKAAGVTSGYVHRVVHGKRLIGGRPGKRA